MPAQPSFPRVIPVPQYSQVITISPNLGEIGAPQCGQFRDVTPKEPESILLKQQPASVVVRQR